MRGSISSLLLAACLLGGAGGCGQGGDEIEAAVPLDQVPGPVMKVAKEKLPGLKFQAAWKERKPDGQEVYEIRGKSPEGKIHDIEITASGQVVEQN